MLEIKIKDENKKEGIYKVDKNIVDGLFLTVDNSKVIENSKAFNIYICHSRGRKSENSTKIAR